MFRSLHNFVDTRHSNECATDPSAIDINDQIVAALRRIVRAIDLHSRRLAQTHGLTGPQALLLREVVNRGQTHATELAQAVSLSNATVTDILNRLEQRGLLERTRSGNDRRRVLITPTASGRMLIEQAPPLLQEQFSGRLAQLESWELTQILSVLQRVAVMMDARELDAAPLLVTGPVDAEAEPPPQATRRRSKRSAGVI
ncbi:MAG: MarR family transcriptional regulator [Immundisolibacter sp.]